MQITVAPPNFAPLSTGHPFGLPGANRPQDAQKRVTPVTQSNGSNTAQTQTRPPNLPMPRQNGSPDGEARVAPPSIMQIKISQILDAQASKRREEAADLDEVEQTAAAPQKPAVDDKEAPAVETETAETEPQEATPNPDAKRAYEDTANLSRNAVFSTLP